MEKNKLRTINDIFWTNIDDVYPQYYRTVSVQLHDGTEHRAWRGSDGESNSYTIEGTNIILTEDEIKQWKY